MRRILWFPALLLVASLTPAATAGTPATVTAQPVERRGVGLVLEGTVTPARQYVYVQRATRCRRGAGCTFTFYRRVAVAGDGDWDQKISVPPSRTGWVYRAKAGTAYSQAWLVCTRAKPSDSCRKPSQ